jgi:hypothetical protein
MKLSAAELFENLEIDMWGSGYTLRPVTRSVAEKLDQAQVDVQGVDEDDNDALVGAMLGMLDVMLAPSGDNTTSVKDLLTKKWEADELGIDWLTAFVESLQEEAGNRRRPTSAGRTSR